MEYHREGDITNARDRGNTGPISLSAPKRNISSIVTSAMTDSKGANTGRFGNLVAR
jgi:hypothetical protein